MHRANNINVSTSNDVVVHARAHCLLLDWSHVTNNNMMWHRATITSHKKLSPTVTGLTLKLDKSTNTTNSSSSSFTFIPGQWVDFQPTTTTSSWKPNQHGSKTIGGYSITSIPSSLPHLELAIQSSHHPVAEWITLYAKVDDCVNLRVGGSFTYTTTTARRRSTDDDETITICSRWSRY